MSRRFYSSSISYFINPNDLDQARINFEMERQFGSPNDPSKPPPQKPGDKKYLLAPAIVGMVIGGILGAVTATLVGLFIFNILIGMVVGGLAGVLAGSIVRKKMSKK